MSVMTQKQRMLGGEPYNITDPELEFERQAARQLLRAFNRTDDESDQLALLEQLLGRIGRDSIIWPPFYCAYGRNTYLGDHVFLSYQCTILDCNEVRIADNVMIGPNVQIYTAAHALEADARNRGWEVAKPVTIEEKVWVGGGAIIVPGVTVGRGAVVGAGAVVSKDVPENGLVVGNPARLLREIDQTD